MSEPTPFELLGGADAVRALVARFYDHMDAHEPQLSRLHETDDLGHVAPAARERFALFLIGWLGGPQDYIATHGHPRLRMRHARVPVNLAMREAWLRSMRAALDGQGVTDRCGCSWRRSSPTSRRSCATARTERLPYDTSPE